MRFIYVGLTANAATPKDGQDREESVPAVVAEIQPGAGFGHKKSFA